MQKNLPTTVPLFGISIDALKLSEAVQEILGWVKQQGSCRYVVTPNVDHIVMLQERVDFRLAYQQSSLVLADGWPIVWASRLLRRPLPQRVAGSDLVPALFDAGDVQQPLRVFLLGAATGVGEQAARQITQRWPHVTVVGTCSPPLGFERDADQNRLILEQISAARPDILLVGLGAPKQELWVQKHHRDLAAPVALCVGATIDFLAGHKRRAPVWMRRTGLEWCHRLLTEPRRLAGRYAKDAWIFPRLVWRQLV